MHCGNMIAVFSDSEQRQTSQDKASPVPEPVSRKACLFNMLESLIKKLFLGKEHDKTGENNLLGKAYFYQNVEIVRTYEHVLCGTNGK